MLPTLQEAVEHPDMTEELAEVLSTRTVNVEYKTRDGRRCELSSELHPRAALALPRAHRRPPQSTLATPAFGIGRTA